jgi:hypothetical protein
MSPFSASSTAPREEGKDVFMKAIFPLFFQIISDSSCAVDLSLENKWAGLLLSFLVLGPGGLLLGHFSLCFVYRGSLGLLSFGFLVDH